MPAVMASIMTTAMVTIAAEKTTSMPATAQKAASMPAAAEKTRKP